MTAGQSRDLQPGLQIFAVQLLPGLELQQIAWGIVQGVL